MKKTISYILFTMIASFVSCSNSTNSKTSELDESKYSNIKKTTWLIGKWQNISADGLMKEIWIKKNDSTFVGSSFFIVGKDTVSLESISLEERGKELFYIPRVKNQNEGKPIIFTLTSLSNTQLVFENLGHDFPQKITYKQVTSDSLVATISGVINGKEKFQDFPMARAK